MFCLVDNQLINIKMILKKNCNYCSKLFEYENDKKRPERRKFCSIVCQRKGRPIFRWKDLSEEEKIIRMKNEFEKKVIKFDQGCWSWIGSIKSGYGILKKDKKHIKIHRFIWEYNFGKIESNKIICHKCDNRLCSNPEHLFIGTLNDNIQDMISKNRQKGALGEKNAKAKLDEKKVAVIKKLLNSGKSIKEISKLFQVTFQTIYCIKIGKRWKDILPLT